MGGGGVGGDGLGGGVDFGLGLGLGAPGEAAEEEGQGGDGSEGAAADEPAAAGGAGFFRDEHGFAEDDVAQQAGEEVAAALFGAQAGGAFLIEAEGAGEGAGEAVDRGAFLGAGGEVDAAQEGGGVELGAAESFLEEGGERGFEAGDLGGEAGEGGAAVWAALGLQAIEQAGVEAGGEGLEGGGEAGEDVGVFCLQVKRVAPDLGAFFAVEVVEVFGEAGQEVGFGDDGVNGHADAEAVGEFLDAFADGAGVGAAFGWGGGGDVGDGDGDEDAVERLAGAGALEEVEEGEPAGFIDGGIGVLGGVAAGGVDQDGVFGEPPVAHAGAADAGDRALAHLGGERELQAGVEECRGFASAGGADDDVPWLFVEVAFGAAGAAEEVECRGEFFAHGGGFFGRGAKGVDTGGGGTFDQGGVGLGAAAGDPEVEAEPDEGDEQDDGEADRPVFEEGQQRAEEPGEGGEDGRSDAGEEPARGEEGDDGTHFSFPSIIR